VIRPTPPYPLVYEPLLRLALAEDLGRAGDLTTEATVAPETQASAKVVARRGGSISGLPMAAGVFALLDPAAIATGLVPQWWTDRLTVYAIGFFFFLLVGVSAAAIAVYLVRTEHGK